MRICSFKIRKARTTTMIGARFDTIAIIVNGRYLELTKLIVVVHEPVNVLKKRGATLSLLTGSQVSFLMFLFN